MRVALLLGLLLVPSAGAWAVTLEAPAAAGADLPFLLRACVAAPEGANVSLGVTATHPDGRSAAVAQAGQPQRANGYGSPLTLDEGGCRDATLRGAAGSLHVVVRARHDRGPPRAAASVEVPLLAAPVAVVPADGRAALWLEAGAPLRVPALGGAAVVPLLPEALALEVDGTWRPVPPAARWRLVEARAGRLEGLVLENAGAAPASTEALRLAGHALPPTVFAPGERRLVGPAATPDLRHLEVPLDVRAGEARLTAGEVGIASLVVPRLAPGERFDGLARGRLGVSTLPSDPMPVGGQILAYATPDAGAAPLVALLDGAAREIVGELYTLTSPDVAAALARAARRGVDVRLLVEGAPVGGIPSDQARLLDALVAAGVSVGSLASAEGFPARYRTQHAKVLVVDAERVHVATENPSPSSYPPVPGGGRTVGFGLVVENATLARAVRGLVEADLAPWPDVRPWRPSTSAPAPVPYAGATGGATLRLAGAWNVTPVASPGPGPAALAALVAGAQERVDVAMLVLEPDFGAGPNPLVEALLEAARGGARVRVLLEDGFGDARNRETASRLRTAAREEGLDLDVRLHDGGRTVHAKVVVVDGRWSYVGSMNGVEAAARHNRELGLVVENATLAAWLVERLEAVGPPPRVDRMPVPAPVGPVAAAVVALIARASRPTRRASAHPTR